MSPFSTLHNQFAEVEQFIDNIMLNEAHRLPETGPIQRISDAKVQRELERN